MAHRNFIDLSMMVIFCSLQTVSLPEGKMVGVWMILGDFDVDFPLQCGDFDERLNGDIDRIVWELIGLGREWVILRGIYITSTIKHGCAFPDHDQG